MKRTRTLRSFSLFHKIVALTLTLSIPLVTMPDLALALPHGGVVSKGQATLGYATGRLLVTQSTSSATFNWSSFTVKSGQSVVYRTPGAASVSLNYIGGTTPSSINGSVTSNGILEFMNPNGLIFGSGSVVSAAGVMAFGSATPWGKPTGAVTNAGTITSTNNGTVALVGSSVTNTGTITAPGGEVLLAAGSTVTPIAQANGASVSVATTGGGTIDDSGILSAETVGGRTGTVLLQSGMASGTTTLESTAVLDASAPSGGNGGKIILNGNTVSLEELAPINVTAPTGTKGTLTIDPSTTDLTTASALEAVDTAQVLTGCVSLGANIILGGYGWTPLGASSPFTGTFNGNGYKVSGYTIGTSTHPYSGNNDVGFIGYLGSNGTVKNLAVAGTIYVTGSNVVGGVVGYNTGTVTNSYNMGTVSSSGSCVGGVVGVNTGTVESSYNTGIVSGGSNVGGVVGYNTGTVKSSYNTESVKGSSSSYFVGGVVGQNSGTVITSYNTGTVTGSSNKVGGVVGDNYSGTVETSYNTGIVSGGSNVGGVVGDNYSGTVKYSYNTGSVTGNVCVGGVVGYTGSTVEYSYNTGTVTASSTVGGVAGDNNDTVEYSYNTGSVISNGSYVGGVVGYNGGMVRDTYYNSNIYTGSGIGSGGSGATGLSQGTSTNELGNSRSYSSSWSFASGWNGTGFGTPGTWIIGTVYPNGGTSGIWAPILVSDLPTATVTGNSGTSVYNGSNVSPGYTTTYTMGASAIPSGITVTPPAAFGPNANSYTVTPTVSGTFTQPTTQTSLNMVISSGTWTITALPVTATANTATMTYGGTVPTLSGTFSTTDQTEGLANLSASWTTPATSASNVGSYAVTPGTYSYKDDAVSGDFSITAATGNGTALTITKADLTASTSGSKVYDGSESLGLTASNTTFTGVDGQTAALNTSLTGTLSSANVGSSLGGTLTVKGSDLTGSSGFSSLNYTLPTSFTGGSITPAALTVTGSQVYNGTTSFSGSNLTVEGVNGQTFTASGSGTLGSSGNVQTNQPLLSVSGLTLSGNGGALASNYTPLSTAQTSVSVTPATLTATATSASMTYGGTVPTLSGTVTGFVPGQTLAGDKGSATWSTSATSSSNAGQYGIAGNVTLGSPYSGDYTITEASGNATTLTITAATSSGVTTTQIVPEVQTVLGFDNVVTPSEAPASTASSGSSPSPVPSGSATPLSSSVGTTLTVLQPAEDGMTGEGIISYETVTPSKRP